MEHVGLGGESGLNQTSVTITKGHHRAWWGTDDRSKSNMYTQSLSQILRQNVSLHYQIIMSRHPKQRTSVFKAGIPGARRRQHLNIVITAVFPKWTAAGHLNSQRSDLFMSLVSTWVCSWEQILSRCRKMMHPNCQMRFQVNKHLLSYV